MAFQVSPGVVTREFDLTTVIPGVDTSTGAFAGVFRWGPIGKRVLVDTEATLAKRFMTPTSWNAETFFTAANFLAYSSALYVSRAANTTSANGEIGVLTAVGNTGSVSNLVAQIVKNEDHYLTKDGLFDSNVLYVARYPGAVGNSLRLSICDNANQFTSSINLASIGVGATLTLNVGSNTATVTINASSNAAADTAAIALSNVTIQDTDLLEFGNSTIGLQYIKVVSATAAAATGNSTQGQAVVTINLEHDLRLHTNISETGSINRYWEFFDLVTIAPGQSDWMSLNGNVSANDELHAVVVDDLGKFTGVPGTVLEVYKGVSRATDSYNSDGLTNYYKDVINQRSQYIWWAKDRAGAVSNTGLTLTTPSTTSILSLSFNGGADGAGESNVAVSMLASAYDLYANPEDVDIGLVIAGKARGGLHGGQIANYLIDNIAEKRKDCVVFVSPDINDTVNNVGNERDDIIDFRNSLRSTSYAVLDSGHKYMYDRYNDVYRYIPMNGDIAGLAAQTEAIRDAWWSPAGYNRGNIKNIVRLAYNPGKTDRDVLYPNGVNPVVTFNQDGTVLFGDKTLLARPSAFDRINVRRLFIVLEKAISRAAKYTLFEFNDAFTRAQFKNMVTPFLRDVKGRRGLYDYLVVCDSTNNPGSVIDRNEFVGDIYLKPSRAVNFITLNFVAVGTDVQFQEVTGKFG